MFFFYKNTVHKKVNRLFLNTEFTQVKKQGETGEKQLQI